VTDQESGKRPPPPPTTELSEASATPPAASTEGHTLFGEVRLTVRDKSPIEVSAEIDGHRVSLAIDKASVVVTDVTADDMTAAQSAASAIAERFLDFVSYRHGFSTKLKHGQANGRSHDTLTGKITNHISATIRMRVSVSHSFVATAADGTVISDSRRPGHVTFQHTISMRYFRAAAKATDVFERFRNYYLAAEHSASVLEPKTRGDERVFLEGMKSVFGPADRDLTRMAAGIDSSRADATPQDVGALLYTRYRCALNHAKEGKPNLVPLQAADEGRVRLALPLMKRVAQLMIRAELKQTSAVP
jgi:hypothetical protein